MTRTIAPALLFVPLLGACGDVPLWDGPTDELLQRLAAEGCPVPDRLAPTSWRVVEASLFSFGIPDGFRQVFVQPIDSEVAFFVRGAESLSYDLALGPTVSAGGGPDARRSDLRPGERRSEHFRPGDLGPGGLRPGDLAGLASVDECDTVLRGQSVHLGLARDGAQLAVVALWPAFEDGGAGRSLSLVGRADTRASADELLAAILSVRAALPVD